MAGMMKQVSTILIVAVVMAAVMPQGEAEITCGTVLSNLSSCLPYVTDKGPIGTCCDGVKNLYAAAKSTPDRQTVCNCLKSMANSYSGLNMEKVAGLPQKCNVDIPYVISPSIDCSKVK